MKLRITFHDVREISSSAHRAFLSTFRYQSEESNSDNSESELSDFDPDIYGCGEITPEVENRNLIETYTEICFWCCCESVKKVSPIIAEATNNLIY